VLLGEVKTTHLIGDAARPRAFKQNNVTPDNLPVTWKHNKKAWMTTAVFVDLLNLLKKRREGSFSLLTMPPAN